MSRCSKDKGVAEAEDKKGKNATNILMMMTHLLLPLLYINSFYCKLLFIQNISPFLIG